LLKVESYKKGIVLSTGFNIFNKGLVFLNGLLVAYFFGITYSTDFFFFIYSSVAILGAFFTSMNSAVIIPESMRIRIDEGTEKSMNFLNFFIFVYGITMAVILLLVLLNPVYFFQLTSNFKIEQLFNNKILIYLSLPLFGLICLINLLVDILASHKFFTISMIVGIINGSISIAFIYLFHTGWGIQSVFFGLIIAYFINLVLLIFLMKKYLHWHFSIKKPSIAKRIWNNLGLAQLSNLTSTLSAYAPIYILSGFNAGIITSLSFAQQISSLPVALIIYQFSSVVGIKFNELYNQKKYSEINTIFKSTADFLMFVVFPVSAMCFLYSDQIISVLLKRGRFSETGVIYASMFLKYLGLLPPMIVINTLFARLFMASHKIKEAFWFQLLTNILQISCIYITVHRFGAIGYPITLLGVSLLSTLLYFFVEKRYFNIIMYNLILKNFIYFILVNTIISIGVFLAIRFVGITADWSTIIVAGSLQVLILLVANHLLGMNHMVSAHILNFTNQAKDLILKSQKIKNGI